MPSPDTEALSRVTLDITAEGKHGLAPAPHGANTLASQVFPRPNVAEPQHKAMQASVVLSLRGSPEAALAAGGPRTETL